MDLSSKGEVLFAGDPAGISVSRQLIAYLKEAFAENRLEFYGRIRERAHPVCFQEQLSSLQNKEWIVYAKPPFGGQNRFYAI